MMSLLCKHRSLGVSWIELDFGVIQVCHVTLAYIRTYVRAVYVRYTYVVGIFQIRANGRSHADLIYFGNWKKRAGVNHEGCSRNMEVMAIDLL
jgi:hypothetical protein